MRFLRLGFLATLSSNVFACVKEGGTSVRAKLFVSISRTWVITPSRDAVQKNYSAEDSLGKQGRIYNTSIVDHFVRL